MIRNERTMLLTFQAFLILAAILLKASGVDAATIRSSAPRSAASGFIKIMAGGNSKHPDGVTYEFLKNATISAITFAADTSQASGNACEALKFSEPPSRSATNETANDVVIRVDRDREKVPVPLTVIKGTRIQSVSCGGDASVMHVASALIVEGSTLGVDVTPFMKILHRGQKYTFVSDVEVSNMVFSSAANHVCDAIAIDSAGQTVVLKIGSGWTIPMISSPTSQQPALYFAKEMTIHTIDCKDAENEVGAAQNVLLSGTVPDGLDLGVLK
jgi:hypothetical protein